MHWFEILKHRVLELVQDAQRALSLVNNILKAWSLDSPSSRGGVLPGSENHPSSGSGLPGNGQLPAGIQGKDPVLKFQLQESRDALT